MNFSEEKIALLEEDLKKKNEELNSKNELIGLQADRLIKVGKAMHNPAYAAGMGATKVGRKTKHKLNDISKKLKEKVNYHEIYRDLIEEKEAEGYEGWITRKESKYPTDEEFSYKPKISILVPVYNVLDKHLVPCIESVINQTYDNWELCLADDNSSWDNVRETLKKYEDNPKIHVVYREKNGHISEATNTALEVATGEYVGLLDCDDLLSENALYEVVKKLNKNQELEFIYSDEDKVDDDGNDRHMPHFKPDWSPDTLMSHMYTCHFTVYKTDTVRNLGGLRSKCNGSQDYDLALRVADTITPDKIAHIAKVLYHWREREESTSGNAVIKPYVFEAAKLAKIESLKRRGLTGSVDFVDKMYQYNVRYDVQGAPLVSIIIPSKDNYDILSQCLCSLYDKTTYRNFEVILVDNGSNDENKAKYEDLAKKYDAQYIYEKQDFNFSHMNNLGVSKAQGEYLLLLNDDIEIVDGDWLEVMLGQAQLEHVGAVGCKLLYPQNEKIQHIGVINIENGPVHAFSGYSDEQIYYFGRNKLCYNVLAVTAACLLIKKSKYEEVGGLDESFAVAYNDVDLCMKLVEAGYYNVVRNDIKNYHHESVSRGDDLIDIDKMRRLMAEETRLYDAHPEFSHYDPFYNVNLNGGADDFSCNLFDDCLKIAKVTEQRVKEHISDKYLGKLDDLSVQRYIYIEGW
ncbi:MAG: glycosyltransferase family 2 protein, partial [Eubacterium sp.]|nr:glycosyltransferase family 2 protein [Eubacterium sp.]